MTPVLVAELASEHSQENVLRAIAHEIRQPLSAIESISYYLSLVVPDDDTHREQLKRIRQLVEQSNWILSNGLSLTDPRPAAPETADLHELLAQALSSRPLLTDPPFKCDLASALPFAHLDPAYGRALIENLLGLFRQLATDTHPALLRTAAAGNGVELQISTAAPGYRSVATLPPGAELSLDCVRHVAILHRGSCNYSIDPVSGIRVRVMLP